MRVGLTKLRHVNDQTRDGFTLCHDHAVQDSHVVGRHCRSLSLLFAGYFGNVPATLTIIVPQIPHGTHQDDGRNVHHFSHSPLTQG